MRILFLLTQDLDSPAGVGRYFPLARELAKLGHQVNIAALHANFDALDQTHFKRDGVNVEYVAPMHVRKQNHNKFYYPSHQLLPLVVRATWALGHAALRTPADIIHIGKPHPMNGLAGLAARYLRGRRVFLDCDDYEAATGHFSGAWQRHVVAFFEDHLPHHVHHITTNTYFLRDRLLALGVPPERITYLPNGVDRARFTPPSSAQVEERRAALGLIGKKVVAFIGSLSKPSHPVDLLLDAFLLIHQAQSQAVLLIVGGGEEFEPLQAKARAMGLENSVRFCGRVPAPEVPLYYHLADVSVDPVYADDIARSRLPLKLFESWACGVPFVTGDVGDRRAVLGTPPAGVLTEPGDPASLARAILHILECPDRAVSLRQRGLERVELFSWERLARKLEAVYLSNGQVPDPSSDTQ